MPDILVKHGTPKTRIESQQMVYFTIAGMVDASEFFERGKLEVSGLVTFTGDEAKQSCKRWALEYQPIPLELVYSDGRRYRGNFRVDHVSRRGQDLYKMRLASAGDVSEV